MKILHWCLAASYELYMFVACNILILRRENQIMCIICPAVTKSYYLMLIMFLMITTSGYHHYKHLHPSKQRCGMETVN